MSNVKRLQVRRVEGGTERNARSERFFSPLESYFMKAYGENRKTRSCDDCPHMAERLYLRTNWAVSISGM